MNRRNVRSQTAIRYESRDDNCSGPYHIGSRTRRSRFRHRLSWRRPLDCCPMPTRAEKESFISGLTVGTTGQSCQSSGERRVSGVGLGIRVSVGVGSSVGREVLSEVSVGVVDHPGRWSRSSWCLRAPSRSSASSQKYTQEPETALFITRSNDSTPKTAISV